MEQAILEEAVKFLAGHYAAVLSAKGKPAQAADAESAVQINTNQPDFAELQLKTDTMQLYESRKADGAFKKAICAMQNVKNDYVWGRLPQSQILYVITNPVINP